MANKPSGSRQDLLLDPPDFSFVLGGPLFQLFHGTRLSDDALELLHRRIVVISLFAWLPLRVLSTLSGQRFLQLAAALNRYRNLLVRLAVVGSLACAVVSPPALADEGGVSVWLPGQFGSLAAVPGESGWSLPIVYYHASANASGGANFAIGGRIAGNLDARADLMLVVPTYTFATPVWGGQAQVSMTTVAGKMNVSAEATLTAPGGAVLSRNAGDSLTGFGDLFPMASLRWNDGNHNWMAYTQVGVPVGSYQVGRLANLGTNHWSADAGGGYTYLNQKTGREFSAVAGVTYNFENPDTNYRNGVDVHLDWGASQFLSEQLHVGLVGYFYNQISGDSGTGARLGDFKSRVNGIGPQIGYLFKMGERQAYINLKGYHEFDNENRPAGWNAWLTLSIPLGSAKK
jgi:hypothetical protein